MRVSVPRRARVLEREGRCVNWIMRGGGSVAIGLSWLFIEMGSIFGGGDEAA